MVHGLQNSNRSPRAIVDGGGRVGSSSADFRGRSVGVGSSRPRAGDALKSAWLDVRHAVKSLFGMRVSTSKPAQISTAKDAAQGVIHAMTKRDVDSLDVAESLSHLMKRGNFSRDASRTGITEGAKALFAPALKDLSDVQLKRLHGNMQRRPELLEGLGQVGTAFALAKLEPTKDDLKGAGAVDDLGFGSIALRECLMDELKERGIRLGEPRTDGEATDAGLELLAKHAVANGGDLAGALAAARRDLSAQRETAADARAADMLDTFEALGLPSWTLDGPQGSASASGVEGTAPARPAPDNSRINAPFSQKRIDWIVQEKTKCYTGANAEGSLVPVAAGTSKRFDAAPVFTRDMTHNMDVRFEGEQITGDAATRDMDRHERVEHFCTSLSDKGLGDRDITLLTQMMNQNTPIVLGTQYLLDRENAPSLKLPDGDEVPLNIDYKDMQWSIARTDRGLELGLTAGADLSGTTMMSFGGNNCELDPGSKASIALTFVLDRDQAGALALTGMRDSRVTMRAQVAGQRLV